jgi:hypothetical protein
MRAMRDWEQRYYLPLRNSLHDVDAYQALKTELIERKFAILDEWCSAAVVKRASRSPCLSDPPRFDPDRDHLTIERESSSEIVILHTQAVGLQSVHRFLLACKGERWSLKQVDILEDESPPVWVSLIL